MKKFNFWTLGITAACLCGLTACSDTSSSLEDTIISDDDSLSSSSGGKDGKSSSGTKTTSSSSRDSVACKAVTDELTSPTDLNVVKNGDNRWILLWNYEQNDSRPESGFVIEVLNMSDKSPKWQTLDSTSADVTMFNLVGESKASKYYRILAIDDCGSSKPTDMIQVSTAGSGSTTASAELAIPTDLKLDTLGNNQWQLSWSYTNNSNRPENGFQLQSLDLNDNNPKWVNDVTTNKGVHVVKIDGTRKGGLIYHVAAKDTNGLSEYSSEIRIPSATDNSSSTNNDNELAVPTDLKIDSTAVNQWKLSWSYTNNKANPENGFVLQALNLEASDGVKWVDMSSVNQGVHYILVNSTKYGGQYIRIAAKNADGKQRSAYSEEILIPKAIAESGAAVTGNDTLAVPTAIKIDSVGENKWQISWSYTNNKANPEKGFVVERLHPDTLKWVQHVQVNEGVHLVKVEAKEKGGFGGYFFRVAAVDAKKNTSNYTTEIQVPNYVDYSKPTDKVDLAVPTALKLDSIGENKWKLSWSYTNISTRPENGFRVETYNLDNPSGWTKEKDLSKGVHSYTFNVKSGDPMKLIHVLAVDSEGESEYSEGIAIPNYVDYSKPALQEDLAVPTALKLDSIGENKWKLTWSYTNNTNRPENGFVVETYNIDNPSGWTKVKDLSKGVHSYTFEVASTDPMKLIHVFAKDAEGTSEYSEGIAIPSYIDYTTLYQLSVPTSLKIDSTGENKYLLSWSYTDNPKHKATKFIIQSMDPTTSTWTEIKTVNTSVKSLALDEKYCGMRIHVLATDGTDNSSPSEEVAVPGKKDYSDVYRLYEPTSLKLDSIGENKFLLSWSYTDNPKHKAKNFKIESMDPAVSTWTSQTVSASVKSITLDKTYCGKRIHVIAIDGSDESIASTEITVPSEKDYSDLYKLYSPTNLRIDSIGVNQYRLSWNYTDNDKNKATGFQFRVLDPATGNWTNLTEKITRTDVKVKNISAEDYGNKYISVAAYNAKDMSDYSETVLIPKKIDQIENLNVPTNLYLDSIGENKYRISWNYTENKNKVATGFDLQVLKPADAEWKSLGSTKAGIKIYDVTVPSGDEIKYVKVAAKYNTEIGEYSNELKIPAYIDYATLTLVDLAKPYGLATEDLGGDKFKLTWSYTDNKDRPATGFALEYIDPTTQEWTAPDELKTKKGIRYYVLDAKTYGDYTFRVRATDKNGESEFSEEIVIPKANGAINGCVGTFSQPSNMKAERIAPNVWRLVWDYSQNTKCLEEHFVIQKVDVNNQTNDWVNFGTTEKNVHYLNLEGSDNLNFYYRVAAVRGNEISAFSNETMLTHSTAYSSEVPFKTPQVKIKLFYYYSSDPATEMVDFMMIVNGNYPNHTMLYSEYTKQFEYQFRWNGEEENSDNPENQWHNVTIKKDGIYETTYTKTFKGVNLRRDFCKSYASVRTIWTQNDAAETKDYTEWSEPIGPLYDGVSTTFSVDTDDDGTPDKTINLCP